jgi:hypothetical protein
LDLDAIFGFPLFEKKLIQDSIWNSFLIECINNPQPIVFFTKKIQASFLNREAIKFYGSPLKVIADISSSSPAWIPIPEFLNMDKYHHYCDDQISTQYCSFSKKKNGKGGEEWMASHEENHFDVFDKLVKATQYFLNQFSNQWVYESLAAEGVNIQFFHPVLVVQGELIKVYQKDGKKIKLENTTHVQYRSNINFISSKQENFHIDVVTEKYFSNYLTLIEKEMNKTVALINSKKDNFEKSIKILHEKIGQKIHESRSLNPFIDDKEHIKKALMFKKQIEEEI